MKIVTIAQWDDDFFSKFVEFRNSIHKDIVTSFPETIEDYKKYFGPENIFSSDYSWEGFLVVEGEKVLAKAILAWKFQSERGNLGFLDWENNLEAASFLIEAVEKSAKGQQLKLIKTPVDLNFFIKYRIRLPGGGEPYWGEPTYPDYYHDLFQKTGFSVIGLWETFRLKKIQGIIDYFLKRKKLATKKNGSHFNTPDKSLRTTVRSIRMNDWDNELKIIHELFVEAYKHMPEWESITFEQFKTIYDDFKYIINPLYVYIVELRGKPVGFSINFADPLSILARVKNKKLSALDKAILFAKLRTNMSCFMIAHVGKIPGPNGEEIKGVQIQVSKRIQVFGGLMRKVLVTFQMTDSPSRRSFETKSQSVYAQYVLYGKELK